MNRVLGVIIGGGLGSGARYLVALGALRLIGPSFPWGTFAVNGIGSFLLGFIIASPLFSSDLRLFFGTGLMGGFTTYSTFNAELVAMIEAGTYGRAAAYAAMTSIACLLGGAGGLWLGRV